MTKNFVVDTNVLLHDPQAIFRFKDNTVIIPIYVIEEIDTFKRELTELGRNAREVGRILDEYRQVGNLGEGVPLNNGGLLRVAFATRKPASQFLHSDKKDNLILGVALEIQESQPDKPCILISKDTNLRVRADALGLTADNFEEEDISSISELYPGACELAVADSLIDELHENGELTINLKDHAPQRSASADVGAGTRMQGFHTNEFVLLKSEAGGGNQTSLGRLYIESAAPQTGVIRPLSKFRDNVWGIRPRNKEQYFALDALLDDSISLVTLIGKAGTGKAQPLDARVLTPHGWRFMGQIEAGMEVISSDGTPARVLDVYPQGEKEIYRVHFSDGSATECCKEHLWYTSALSDGEHYGESGSVKSLEEILGTLRFGARRARNHAIPMTRPVEFEPAELPLEPYRLGVLMATKSWPDNLLTDDVESSLDKLGLWGAAPETRFIPKPYLLGSIAQRLAVLQGLMDTEGTVSRAGRPRVTVASERLAEDLRQLTQSLGGTLEIRVREQGEGKPTYRCEMRLPREVAAFGVPHKLSEVIHDPRNAPRRDIDCIEYVGKKIAQCIMIDHPDHLYLTDDFVVTHNTLLAIAAGLRKVTDDQAYQKLVVSRPIFPMGRDIGYLPGTVEEKLDPWMRPIFDNVEFLMGITRADKRAGRGADELKAMGIIEIEPLTYIRGRSMPNLFMIVDEAQNLTPHEIKTILTRVGEGTKIVLTGDPYQIDNPYVDSESNGLTYAVNRFKGQQIAATVSLFKGERSELAELAANLL